MDWSIERTPAGRRIVVERTVDATPERAWRLLRDVVRWPEWGPSVRAVDCAAEQLVDGRYVRAGSRGRVRVPGVWIPFRVSTCTDRRWTWRIGRPGTSAMTRTVPATGHRVRATDRDATTCQVGFEVPTWAAPYAAVCRRALESIARLLEGTTPPDSDHRRVR